MTPAERSENPRRLGSPVPRQPARPRDSTLSDAELMGRWLQLRRKLATATEVWHSGRIDRLAEALHSLEEEMHRRRQHFA